jgi:phosphoketolase
MQVRNMTSRYHLLIAIFEKLSATDKIPKETAQNIIIKYQKKITENTDYAKIHGVDMEEINSWTWNGEGIAPDIAKQADSVIDA